MYVFLFFILAKYQSSTAPPPPPLPPPPPPPPPSIPPPPPPLNDIHSCGGTPISNKSQSTLQQMQHRLRNRMMKKTSGEDTECTKTTLNVKVRTCTCMYTIYYYPIESYRRVGPADTHNDRYILSFSLGSAVGRDSSS